MIGIATASQLMPLVVPSLQRISPPPEVSITAEKESLVFVPLKYPLEFIRNLTALELPLVMENAGLKLIEHELPAPVVQVMFATALPHVAFVFASIKLEVITVPLETAKPVNLTVTVLIVRSSAAFAAQFMVATSSTATRVRPVAAPIMLEVKDGFVRYTTCAVPPGVPDTIAEALESLPYAVTEEVAAMLNTWLELDEAPPDTKVAMSPLTVMVFEPFLGTISEDELPREKVISPVVALVIVMLTGPASKVSPSYNCKLLNDEMPALLPPPIVSLKVISVKRTSSVLFAVSFIL